MAAQMRKRLLVAIRRPWQQPHGTSRVYPGFMGQDAVPFLPKHIELNTRNYHVFPPSNVMGSWYHQTDNLNQAARQQGGSRTNNQPKSKSPPQTQQNGSKQLVQQTVVSSRWKFHQEAARLNAAAAGNAAPNTSDVTTVDLARPTYVKTKKLSKTAGFIMEILNREAVAEARKEKHVPNIRPGYVVQVKVEVPENKRRVQEYKGLVIAKRNAGIHTSFRIRRNLGGTFVETVLPLYSPHVKEIKVLEKKKVKRAKLYYLREGKHKL